MVSTASKNLHFILESFLEENFPDVNNIYFEKLIKYLSEKENSQLLENCEIVNILNRCVEHLESNWKRIHCKVYAFMLNLCSLMVKNATILKELQEKHIIDRFLSLIEKYGEQFNPSIKLGYIRVLRSLAGIDFGLDYIRLHPNTWHYPIRLCNVEHTIYVIREVQDLIFHILFQYSVSEKKDEQLVLEILEKILQPIQENTYKEDQMEDNSQHASTTGKDTEKDTTKDTVKDTVKDTEKNRDKDTVKDTEKEVAATMNEKKDRKRRTPTASQQQMILINVDDAEIQSRLQPTLDLLSYIFEKSLTITEGVMTVATLCHERFQLEISVWKMMEMAQNQQFVGKILRTLTTMNFARLIGEEIPLGGTMTSPAIQPERFNHFGLKFFNTMKFCVNRNELLNFLQLAELNHVLWKRIAPYVPKMIKIDDELISFENQLITFHLLPILYTLLRKQFYEPDIFDKYLMKLFEINSEHTLRICYAFRDTLMDATACTTKYIDVTKFADLAYKSINGILSMEKILDREQAIVVFQAMIYALKTFIDQTMCNAHVNDQNNDQSNDVEAMNSMENRTTNADYIVLVPNVLYSTLIGLRSLIERYHITWTESLETISLVNMIISILNNTNLNEKLAVQALKLLQLSIEHFLSPNMTLLLDNLDDSSFVCLGPILLKRLHDVNWEVRDSALELLTSIADISYCKYPAFQAFLKNFEFCGIVHGMAENDSEMYVVASTLKCLMKMYRLPAIWNINQEALLPFLFQLLYRCNDGLISKEALKMLAMIQKESGIPATEENLLFSTVANCLLNNGHWEVRIEALHFCESEIQKQLSEQGMLDGIFPAMTFSKETKQIVNLTKEAINVRIYRVLKEVARRGYLGMILSTLREEDDPTVRKEAILLIQRLMEQLNNYDYPKYLKDLPETLASESCPRGQGDHEHHQEMEMKEEKEKEVKSMKAEHTYDSVVSDRTIESILNIGDIYLLNNVYSGNLSTINMSDKCQGIDPFLFKKYTIIGPKEFIDEVNQMDLQHLLSNNEQVSENLDNFQSLLEDIMAIVRPDHDYHVLNDCY